MRLKDMIEKGGEAVSKAVGSATAVIEEATDRIRNGEPIIPDETIQAAKDRATGLYAKVQDLLTEVKGGTIETAPGIAMDLFMLGNAVIELSSSIGNAAVDKVDSIIYNFEDKIELYQQCWQKIHAARAQFLLEVEDLAAQFQTIQSLEDSEQKQATLADIAKTMKGKLELVRIFNTISGDFSPIPTVWDKLGITEEEFDLLVETQTEAQPEEEVEKQPEQAQATQTAEVQTEAAPVKPKRTRTTKKKTEGEKSPEG